MTRMESELTAWQFTQWAGRSGARGPRLRPVPAAFVARGLEKRYGETLALDGVDLEVGEGELVGLLGPNG